jgi:hypothetical protein
MGWGSGSEIFNEIVSVVMKEVPEPDARQRIYEKLIPTFEMFDWDTQIECIGNDNVYKAALKKLHPDWFEDD